MLGDDSLNTALCSSATQPKMPVGVGGESLCVFPSDSALGDWKHSQVMRRNVGLYYMWDASALRTFD